MEKLFIIFIVIEAINVINNLAKNIKDVIDMAKLKKTNQNAVDCQAQAVRLQEEQLKLNKFYSEKQDEQNENIKQLAFLITEHNNRLTNLEDHMIKTMPKEKAKKTVKKPATKKTVNKAKENK